MPDELTGQQAHAESIKRPDPKVIPEEVIRHYQTVFNSEMGRVVLTHMLSNDQLGLFSSLYNVEDMYRHNYAVNILANIGVVTPDSMPDLIHAIMNTLPERVKKGEQ